MAVKKKRIRLLAVIFSVAAVVVLAAAALLFFAASARYDGEKTRVYIPTGTAETAIGDSLRASLGETFGSRVFDLWRLQRGKTVLAAGSYVVEPGMNAISLSRKILQGRQTPVRVTFNNMRTLDQLSAKIASYLQLSSEQFAAACDSVFSREGIPMEQYIAQFVPDTYEFYWTTSPEAVVKKLAAARNAFWTEERLSKAQALGLTPAQVATVASIVEEETAKADEKPTVARLYLNRLDKKMLLQADPTVKFAVGDFGLKRIRGEHLKLDSPYNTYLYQGLPPGPIRMASQRGIDAVLDAPRHDYLYMCAKEDFSGYHNFAHDFATHTANARRYQKALNQRGIH